ncbi:hypothetical protein Tco_0502787 [Tanacetum coccineum]
MSRKMSQTEGMVSPGEIHPINSNADEEGGTTVLGCDQNDASIRKEMQKRVKTVKSVGAKRTTRSIRKDSLSQDSQSKENVSVLPQEIKCRLWHLKKTPIIDEGTVYKSDGKIMLHSKALPKDCYKVSIDKSLVDATFIPDAESNGCTIVLDVVGGFVAWPKNQATPPSTIQMITVENKTASKVPTKRQNFYVSSNPMQKEDNKKRSQKALCSYAKPQPNPKQDVTQCRSSNEEGVAGNQDSEKSTPSPSITGSPGSIYQPGWGVPNSCRLDTPKACQDVVDHIAPPGYFSELRHLPTDEFLSQYNINLAKQVAMGSHLRLRFEQVAKLLKKSVAQVARRDQRIATMEKHIKDLEAQLEAEINMKKATEVKNSEVTKELEDLRMRFSGLEVGNAQLSQQVSVLQAQVMGEKRIMAAFEDFKKHEVERVNARCAEMDARLDALSIDFDEELYPHMLTAIAGRIAEGMSEGLKYDVEHGKAGLELTAVEAYDPEADNKYVVALHDLKDLNYPLIDELEQLKDAPLDVIMASLYLDSDTGEDAPQFIRDLCPSSSQLRIPVYPEVHDPRNP